VSARTRALGLLIALAALLAASIPAADVAQAREVANPRNFTGVIQGGLLRIKTTSLDLSNLPNGVQFTVNGPISPDGAITIPKARIGSASGTNGVYAPDIPFSDYTIRVVPTHDWTGYVNPMTGAMNLRVRFRLELRGGALGGDGSCKIASDSNPIDVNVLSTGNPHGRPYNPANGTAQITNTTLAINQTAGGCGPGGLGNGTVNDTVGLPSGSGNNEARFDMKWSTTLGNDTYIRKAVNAAFTATPSNGLAPQVVQLNGSSSFTEASTAPANSIATYQWDFDDNGSWDTSPSASPSASHTYANPGTYTARLRVTDNGGDYDETTRTITISPRPPDLKLTKSHVGAFRVGAEGVYTLTVANKVNTQAGPTTGPVTITDTLPAGLTYVGATGAGWTCANASGTVTCTNPFPGTLAPNASSSVNLRVVPTTLALGTVTNTATVTTPGESQPADNTASDETVVTGIDLAMRKSHPGGAFQIGQVRQYNLDVVNEGAAATVGTTTVTDTLPAGLTFDSAVGTGWGCSAAGQQVTCTRSLPIAGGETSQARIRVLVGGVPRTVTNTASVSTLDDVDPSDNTDDDLTPIYQTPDLALTKTVVGEVRVDEQATYTLAVKNDGTQAADGTITVTDELPAGLTYVSASGTGWSCDEAGGTVTCSRSGAVAIGASLPDITLVAAVGPAAAPVEDDAPELANTAALEYTPAGGGEADPNPDNDTATATALVKRVDLTLDKSHVGAFRVGGEGTYTLSVRNRGNQAATGTTTVTDALPAGMTYVAASGDGWTCGEAAGTVTCTRTGAIAASAAAPPISLTVGLQPAAAPSKVNTATVANASDHWASNDADSDITAVTQVDLGIVKEAVGGQFRAGEERVYTLKLSNSGIASTGATTVTDTLPAGLAFKSATGAGWACSYAAPDITCVRTAIVAANATLPPITVRAEVLPTAVPEVTNTATVATAGDNNTGDNTSSVTRSVVAPDLAVEVDGDETLRRLGTATYTVAVTNEGTDATRLPITVTDALPDGLTFVSASGDGWACTEDAGTVTCERSADLPASTSAAPIAIRAKVAADAPATIANEVTVSGTLDSDPSDNAAAATAPVKQVDLALAKKLVGDIQVGQYVTYDLAVRNDGDIATTGQVKVTDTLPAGLRFVSAFGGEKWSCGNVGAEVTCTYVGALGAEQAAPQAIKVEAEVLGTAIPAGQTSAPVTNTATVTNAGDVDPSDNTGSATGTATTGPDATIDIRTDDASPSMRAGADTTYLLSVRNVGSKSADGDVEVVTTLGAGLTFKSDTAPDWTCTAAGQVVTCDYDGAAIAPSARRDLGLVVGVGTAAVPSVRTTTTVDAAGDANPVNDDDEIQSVVGGIDLATTLSHAGAFTVGGTGTYTIGVRNLGTLATRGPIDTELELGRGVTATSAAGDGWTCSLGGIVRCRFDGLARESAAPEIVVNVELGSAAAPQTTAIARTSTPGDAAAANDTASDLAAIVDTTATPLTLGFNDGELAVGGLNLKFGESGVAITLAGRVSSNGTFTVPASGFTASPISVQGIFQATLKLMEDAVGTYDRSTGAITLRAKLGLTVAGGPAPAGCGLGISGEPIVVDLTTGQSGGISGAPINGAGDVTLVSNTFGVPASSSCGGLDGTLNSLAGLPSGPGANRLVLRGRLGTALPAPPAAKPSTAASTVTPKAPKKVSIVALRKQKALRDGFKLTATPTENGTLKLTTTIKVAGQKKAVKLKAKSVKLRKGKPTIVRIKATGKTLKALKAALKKKRKIQTTISAVFTGTGKATEKSTYKVTVTG
jgi:uncharacterized repeat protein (TIGR01451 family)